MNSGEPMYSLGECCDKPMDGKERQDSIHRQSDYLILAGKPMKVGGAKGIAGMRGRQGAHLPGPELGDRWERNLRP